MNQSVLHFSRRQFLGAALVLPFAMQARAEPDVPLWKGLVDAATAQIGVTTLYDPSYVSIPYPMGDVPRDRGVCCDVIIRACRDGWGLDLQQLVHEDMQAHFSKYPKNWGLSRTDTNIDHRRVPNLATFFRRAGAELMAEDDLQPGDIVTLTVPNNLPHIAIMSNQRSGQGRPLHIIHNIGGGTQIEDRLAEFPITGRFRWHGASP